MNAFPDFPFQIQGRASLTGNLVHALGIELHALGQVHDVDLTNQRPRFKAMFKDETTKNFVRGILRSIAQSDKLGIQEPDPKTPSAPYFACVLPTRVAGYRFLLHDPYAFCSNLWSGKAFRAGASSFVFSSSQLLGSTSRTSELELSTPCWKSLGRRRSNLEHVPWLPPYTRHGTLISQHGFPWRRHQSTGGISNRRLCTFHYLRFLQNPSNYQSFAACD